jgi:cell division protein FtsB
MRNVLVWCLLLLVAGYYSLFGGEYSAPDLRTMRERIAATEREADRLEGEAAALAREVARLESDPILLERLARERFGMIRDGERLYRFVEAIQE